MSGAPLDRVRVVELAGQGPGPFACMLLADLGADVVAVERIGGPRYGTDAHQRGRRSVCVDVKDARGRDVVLRLAERADVLIEGYRPGVAERLGLGPADLLAANARLVYGRMTGWGQDGPLAQAAGHDINYLALSGGLAAIGEPGRPPVPPLNLVADYGAGGMLLVVGVLAALFERAGSGRGQVVDAAMLDGAALMLAPFLAQAAHGRWSLERGVNVLDGGAPFYTTYETADGRWISVGAIEATFYARFLQVLGLRPSELGAQMDRDAWPAARQRIAHVIRTRTRAEWCQLFEDADACVQPVLDLTEATNHPHAVAREMYDMVEDVPYPKPAPRFSRTPLTPPAPPEAVGSRTDEVLDELGLSAEEIAKLHETGVVA